MNTETKSALNDLQAAVTANLELIAALRRQVNYYKGHYDQAKARAAYPEFCKHPGKCAGTGRCMAEWVCND